MALSGITVGVRDKDGNIEDGTPEGMQIIDGTLYMTVKLKDGSLVRIEPPRGWEFSSDTGWHYNWPS